MTDLKSQKRMASEVMDVGEDRVWIDPEEQEKVAEAITRKDIRNLVEGGTIQKRDEKGTSKGRAKEIKKQKKKGQRKGQGSRKGKQGARKSDKQKWMEKIRSIRERLKEMKENKEISNDQYRELYNMSKGGFFRDLRHLENHVEDKMGSEE
jgi:large subunit ribosomal protein L19e